MGKNKSSLMLKYQKAKVKLREYEIPEQKWPDFPLKYRDLAYPTVLTISKYAEAINENLDKKVSYKALRYCSDFYDAALQSREQQIHDADFALSGAAAYFFMDNFGSAKVLWKSIKYDDVKDEYLIILYDVFSLAFTGRTLRNSNSEISHAIKLFWENGDKESFVHTINGFRENIFAIDSPQAWFWGEITCAVAKLMGDSSARVLLPLYSALDNSKWKEYFERKSAINLLWPSQRLVGSSKILQGENAIVQLPTGVGKTKSIELIIWAMLLSERGRKAMIVAPLRSLCNEITHDMKRAFPDEISINQFSDVLEDDFINILLGQTEKQILICTPEKLQYIFHHDNSYLGVIDLYIFDESHMFDDRSRGALYELLLTDIKHGINKKQQLVLMSAVLPNANQIVEWLFGKEGVLAYDSAIKSTPKAIGFADKNHQVHYYSAAEDDEDFFVPYTYTTQKLELFGKERKERVFPESPQDIALYYTNILCKTGGVAIYFNQRRSIPKFFERMEDLINRGCLLTRMEETADEEEILKFQTIYEAYYGKESIFTRNIKYGVLPHYSSLPNGIKISTEYAFKRNSVKAIACTSTLAQGVNIPIKYLLITGTNFSLTQMSVRNFQNLIGRTGRAGVYTEGDIIVTTSKLYDEREQRGKGYYKWKEAKNLFDVTAMEACGSSILNLVKDFEVAYTVTLHGSAITQYICDNIRGEWNRSLLAILLEEIKKIDSNINIIKSKQDLSERIANYKGAIDSIENEMIYLLLNHPLSETSSLLREISKTLLENTLAYYLGNESEKKLLQQLFGAIEEKVEEQINGIQKYSGTMVSIADADQIIEWIEKKNINSDKQSARELLFLIEELFDEIYSSLKLETGFALAWIRGDSYEQISKKFETRIYDVEKICQYNISYQMSFLVGNIIDLVDVECVNIDALQLLQQALRYGVNTRTAVSICEKIFNDRFLAKEIVKIIGNNGISPEDIVLLVKGKKDDIMLLLHSFPSYFENVIENL